MCKRAGLTYQHVFMREKTEAGREASLLKILSERGLHPKSSADQIQRVRAEVELAKDLDGIDASNVIEGGRRRRAATVNQWGQAIDYRKANGGGSDSDSDSESSEDDSESERSSEEEDPEALDEEEEKGAKGAKKANETSSARAKKANETSSARAKEKSAPLASPAEEGVDVFFHDDDSSDEDAPSDDDKPSSAARSEPAPAERKPAPAKTDAPRRGAALLDSDDDE